jgi:hypothetical protein
MLADFFTKPLQGSLFRKFRDVLLGIKHTNVLTDHSVVLPEERVGVTGSHSEPPVVGNSVESSVTVPVIEEELTNSDSTSNDGFTVVLGKKKQVRTGHKKAIANTNEIRVPHAPDEVRKIRIANNRRSFSNFINSKRSA